MMANLRLVLDVEVKAGDQSHSCYSLPGLMALLDRLPENGKPEFVRGDIGWGTDGVMKDLEGVNQSYLFKLKKSNKVMNLIYKHHGLGEWTSVHPGWEAKDDDLHLQGWERKRRVVIIRRKISSHNMIGMETNYSDHQQLSFIEGPENTKAFEYSVLVTDRECDLTTLFYHYRDRADCENNFDELKNQWGWGGYTTKDVKSCRLISRIISLIYNWWSLYVRLALPDKHYEAITSRPLLLSSVGRATTHSAQKTIAMTSGHGKINKLAAAHHRLSSIFSELKSNAPQLSVWACWKWILEKITASLAGVRGTFANLTNSG